VSSSSGACTDAGTTLRGSPTLDTVCTTRTFTDSNDAGSTKVTFVHTTVVWDTSGDCTNTTDADSHHDAFRSRIARAIDHFSSADDRYTNELVKGFDTDKSTRSTTSADDTGDTDNARRNDTDTRSFSDNGSDSFTYTEARSDNGPTVTFHRTPTLVVTSTRDRPETDTDPDCGGDLLSITYTEAKSDTGPTVTFHRTPTLVVTSTRDRSETETDPDCGGDLLSNTYTSDARSTPITDPTGINSNPAPRSELTEPSPTRITSDSDVDSSKFFPSHIAPDSIFDKSTPRTSTCTDH
jgi:hypothetical protein